MKLKKEKVTFLKNQTFNNIKANSETETDLKRKKPEKIWVKIERRKDNFSKKHLRLTKILKVLKRIAKQKPTENEKNQKRLR